MQTVELLEALCNGAGATIHASDGTIWQLAGLQPPAHIDLPALRRQLEAFGQVAREFKITPIVPADVDRASWKSIAYLAEAMRTGRVLWRSPVPFGFLLSPAVAEELDAELHGQPGDITTHSHRAWSINGVGSHEDGTLVSQEHSPLGSCRRMTLISCPIPPSSVQRWWRETSA